MKLPRKGVPYLLLAAGVLPLVASVWFVLVSLRWPLVGDATLMHYCILMMRSGYAPYRQLIDINLPGTYFFEWLVTALFGYGGLPWRIFDLVLLLCLGLSAGVILRSSARSASRAETSMAVWATCLFALLHGRDGIEQLGQRDLLMTAWLSLGCAALFLAHRADARRSLLGWAAAFGASVCIAATIKPLAILLLPVWLACLAVSLRRQGRPIAGVTAVSLAAGLAPLFGCAAWSGTCTLPALSRPFWNS